MSHAYAKALKQEHIEAIGKPTVQLEKIKEGEELSFTLTTAVMPEVKLTADWKKAVKTANAEHRKTEAALVVTDQEVEDELKRLASMRAAFVTVNRPAALEDSVEVDFEVRQDGVIIEGGKSEKHPLVLGKGVFIPGFEEAIVGMSADEEKTITLSFPEDYHAKHLAGKPAEFFVKVRLVQERQVAPIDDAFAASLGAFASLVELKQKMTEGILEEKKQQAKESGRTAILDTLVSAASIEFPVILVEEELDRMAAEFQAQVEQMGIPFEQYLERVQKSVEALKEEWQDQAKRRLSANLILEHLAEEDQIVVDSTEIEGEMNRVMQHYKEIKDAKKNIDLERLYAATSGRLRHAKVLEMLEKL